MMQAWYQTNNSFSILSVFTCKFEANTDFEKLWKIVTKNIFQDFLT